MATLIGDGGHADDIWNTLPHGRWTRVNHHKEFKYSEHFGFLIIGVNDPRLRSGISAELLYEDSSWVHPGAQVYDSIIYYGAHVNYAVSMTRTTVGHHATISPGVTICGDVTIGDRVFIGAGSVIKNLVTIGDDAFIRMGSIVTRDIAPGERY